VALLPSADAVDGALLRADELGCVRLANLPEAAADGRGRAATDFLVDAVSCTDGRCCVTLVAGVTEAADVVFSRAPEATGLVTALEAFLPDTDCPARVLAAGFVLRSSRGECPPSLSAPLSSLDIIVVTCLFKLVLTFCATPLRLGV